MSTTAGRRNIMLIDGVNVLRKPFIDILVKNAKTVTQLEGINYKVG